MLINLKIILNVSIILTIYKIIYGLIIFIKIELYKNYIFLNIADNIFGIPLHVLFFLIVSSTFPK